MRGHDCRGWCGGRYQGVVSICSPPFPPYVAAGEIACLGDRFVLGRGRCEEMERRKRERSNC
jgi:hypothetical protein